MYAKYIKRIIDFILSFIAVIVFSPLLLVIAVLVKINLGAPVIFKQERIGLTEKIFTMYKFRTMNDKRDKNGELLPDIYRQTRLGDILRSTSLDELPELINILRSICNRCKINRDCADRDNACTEFCVSQTNHII